MPITEKLFYAPTSNGYYDDAEKTADHGNNVIDLKYNNGTQTATNVQHSGCAAQGKWGRLLEWPTCQGWDVWARLSDMRAKVPA